MEQRRSTFDLGAGTSMSPPSADASEGTEEIITALRNGVSGETLALLDELKNRPARTWQKQAGLLAISLVLFFSVGLFQWSVLDLAIVIAVLLVHESGHYVVMRAFGYRDLRMFFIPFVGAAVSGWSGKAHGYQRTLVALAGPVPGILLGLLLAVIFVLRGHPLVGHAAVLFLAINGFNLLPLLPLDGGRVLEETLFCRTRWLEAGFQVVAGLALLVIAFLWRDLLLGVLGAAVVVAAPARLTVSTIAAQLREAGEAPDITSPSDATLTFLVRIATEIEQRFSRPLKPQTLAAYVRSVMERMNRRAPSAGATVLLLGGYAAAIVLAVVGVGVIAVGERVRGDTAQAVLARLSATDPERRSANRGSDLYSAGQRAYSRKDYATAIGLWNIVVADDPRHPHAWDAIGMAYCQTGQWAEAVNAISEQLKVTPSHDRAWVDLGWALQQLGKPKEAISAYRKHIEIKPLDTWAHKELGLLLLDAHEWKDASAELRRAAALTPDDAEVHVALGRACLKEGDVAAAVEAFERAKTKAWYGLISELAVYLARERVALDRAEAWAKEATTRAAALSLILTIDTVTMDDTMRSWGLSWSWYATGLSAYQRGDFATAERYLRAAHSVRASTDIARDLGIVVEKIGRRSDAMRLYGEALALGRDEEARSRLKAIGVRDNEVDSLIADARQVRNNRLAISLGKGEQPAGSAEALILFANGRSGAQVRAVRPNPNLESLLARARTAVYPVQFPDETPAQLAGWGEVRCANGKCALLLALGRRPPAEK